MIRSPRTTFYAHFADNNTIKQKTSGQKVYITNIFCTKTYTFIFFSKVEINNIQNILKKMNCFFLLCLNLINNIPYKT